MPSEPPDLSRIIEAAWIVDLDCARVIAASPAGRSLWAGAWREGATLDAAMPAMAELERAASSDAVPHERVLLIWISEGVAHLRCRCQPLAGSGRKVLVTSIAMRAAGGHLPGLRAAEKARAMLAHELRTPLSAIAALADVMKDERLGSMGNARYLVYANDIYESARHALSVIEVMLEDDAGLRSVQDPACTNLHQSISRCLSALGALADNGGVRLESNLAAGHVQIAIERRSLTQILLNLLSNALKFTPRGGAITVETRRGSDGGLVLSVRDTGPGMATEQLKRVRAGMLLDGTAGARHGSGYGLPLVRALARSAGAELDILSNPGQGTCITVTFPPDRLIEPISGPS